VRHGGGGGRGAWLGGTGSVGRAGRVRAGLVGQVHGGLTSVGVGLDRGVPGVGRSVGPLGLGDGPKWCSQPTPGRANQPVSPQPHPRAHASHKWTG
jgi:hypothetical protein